MFLIAFLLLTLGLFGLRGVISNVYFVDLVGSQTMFFVLRVFYWGCLLAGAAAFVLWLRRERTRLLAAWGALRRDWLYALALALTAAPFLTLVVTKRLDLDFWLDEVISIRRHIVTELQRALFWYPVPNNHVFTNALSGIYLKLIGAKDLLTVLQHPAILRAFYLAFGLGTLLVVAWTAHRFAGRAAAFVIVLLFSTTLAYLNFIVQVRGYSPSIFFAAALQLAVLIYWRDGRRSAALAAAAFAVMLLYTIPSNLYFLLALFLIFLLLGLYQGFARRSLSASLAPNDFHLLNRPLTLSLSISLGCGLALLAYLPILKKVLENRYVETLGAFKGTAFPGLLQESLVVFISGRVWLFALAAVGLLLLFVRKNSAQRTPRLAILYLSVATMVLPYLLSTARGDEPFVRTFFVLLPAFFLLAAIGVQVLVEQVPWPGRAGKAALALALAACFVYANVVFFANYTNASAQVAHTLAIEDVDQVEFRDSRLDASVFMDHYHLRQVIDAFQTQADPGLPVLVDRANTRYLFTLTTYLEAYTIDFREFDYPAEIQSPEAYIFLSYPQQALYKWEVIYPDMQCENISPVLTIYQVLHCRFE